MRNIISFILIMLCLFLSSCATEQKYKYKVNAWIGAAKSDVIKAWGEPNRSPENNNVISYTDYKFREVPVRPLDIRTIPSQPLTRIEIPTSKNSKISIPFGNIPEHQTNIDPLPPQNITFSCTTLFHLNTIEVVTAVSFYGNNCLAQ